ncbi:hypothetical protein DH2020_007206 [Rehmannia glutinosa]|uniref:Uncharacterized protein n=1 Tax=Rehmannia glutinosa TaxID=99300 RepID=A0ABR0TXJ6_REHGL
MEQEEGQNGQFESFRDIIFHSPVFELRRCGEGNGLFDKELKAYKGLFQEDDEMDESYKSLMLCLTIKHEQIEPQKKRKDKGEEDDELLSCPPTKKERHEPRENRKDEENVNEHDGVRENAEEKHDPQYELFLKRFNGNDESRVVESEKDPLDDVADDEEDVSSEDEWAPERWRKLDTATKQNIGLQNEASDVEKQKVHDQEANETNSRLRRVTRSMKQTVVSSNLEKTKSSTDRESSNEVEEVEIEKLSAEEFRNALMSLSKSRDQAEKTAIEKRRPNKFSLPHKNVSANNFEEVGEDSDVEILDGDACLNGPFVPSTKYNGNVRLDSGPFRAFIFTCSMEDDDFPYVARSVSGDEYRKHVMDELNKPFDVTEYKRVQKDFKDGCYVDYHPDVGRKLTKYRYNRRKRLAILRGFFFWLQNITREGAFKPWKDGTCLAVEPQFPETSPHHTSGPSEGGEVIWKKVLD